MIPPGLVCKLFCYIVERYFDLAIGKREAVLILLGSFEDGFGMFKLSLCTQYARRTEVNKNGLATASPTH